MDTEFGAAALAIYAGDLVELRRLLAADPALATRTSSVGHPTLLQLVACEEPDIADPVGAADILVAAGAPTHGPLVSAAGCASLAVLEFLLDAAVPVDGEDERWSPLDEAVYWSNAEIAELLLRRGARVRALSTAAGLGDPVLAATFLADESSMTAAPIGSPFPDTIPGDLARDADSILDHAFVMAVNNGHQATAALLIDAGAHINATPPGYHWRGTALHAAVWRGDRDLVEWLLTLGADPTIRDGLVDSDAAGWAEHHGHPELLEMLTHADGG